MVTYLVTRSSSLVPPWFFNFVTEFIPLSRGTLINVTTDFEKSAYTKINKQVLKDLYIKNNNSRNLLFVIIYDE